MITGEGKIEHTVSSKCLLSLLTSLSHTKQPGFWRKCSGRKGVKKRGVLDCVVLSGGVNGEHISIALHRRLAETDDVCEHWLCIPHAHTNTYTYTNSALVVLWDDGEWWLCLLRTDSRSPLSPKKPILKASPQSQQHRAMESNLKFGSDWPSSTRINDCAVGESLKEIG